MAQYEHDSVVPIAGSNVNKKLQVEQMFDDIAPKYDLLNHLLSLGVDKIWRKKVVRLIAALPHTTVLDVATGTGDLAIALSSLPAAKITGLDLSQLMLDGAAQKIEAKKLTSKITLQKGDSEQLPFANETYDAATVAFGVRNFENLDAGLAEICRVLKKDGTLIVLEFSKVKIFPLKQLFQFYFRYITPLIGKAVSARGSAYQYLPQSVAAFPEGQEMCSILQRAGFSSAQCTPLSFGIASIYQCKK